MNITNPTFASAPSPAHVEGDIVSELARWLTNRMTTNCASIVLAQVTESGHSPVDEWDLADLCDAHALAQVIYSAGVRDSQTLRVSTTYGVFALRVDRADPRGRFLFRVEARQGWLQASNTPDERGLVAMLMQHTDAAARLSLGHSRGIIDQYERLNEQSYAQQGRMLEQAYARIAVLEAREMEALELRDKLQSMARDRDLEFIKLEQQSARKDKALQGVMGLAPMVLGGLGLSKAPNGAIGPSMPASPMPEPATARAEQASPTADATEDLLVKFLLTLSGDDFVVILSQLQEHQQKVLSTLYHHVDPLVRGARIAANDEAARAAAAGGAPFGPPPAASGDVVPSEFEPGTRPSNP